MFSCRAFGTFGYSFTLCHAKINHSFSEGVIYMNEQQFDKYLHINTIGEQYGFPKLAHYHRYEPTPYAGLEQLFEQYVLPENPVFVDMGCGKGRVPIYMYDKFHIPTVGIEMDAGFYEEAEHNKISYVQKRHTGAAITFKHTIAEQYAIKSVDNIFFSLIHFPLTSSVQSSIIFGNHMSKTCVKFTLFYIIHRMIIYNF